MKFLTYTVQTGATTYGPRDEYTGTSWDVALTTRFAWRARRCARAIARHYDAYDEVCIRIVPPLDMRPWRVRAAEWIRWRWAALTAPWAGPGDDLPF